MGLDENQWNIGAAKNVTMEKLWAWSRVYGMGSNGNKFTAAEHCTKSEKDSWFDLVNSMWRKHHSAFQ